MEQKTLFWPAFWITHALLCVNWIIVWSESIAIPQRVHWFFLVIPAIEVLVLLGIAFAQRRFAKGIVTAVVIQAFLYLPQFFFMAMYAGLGDNPDFFK